jgi:HEAT repeat protein
VAIRRSAAVEIQPLIDDLCGPDDAARETAGVRLAVIGERAVPHLVKAFEHTASAVARAAIMKVFEACRDRRGLDLALDIVDDPSSDPKVLHAARTARGPWMC